MALSTKEILEKRKKYLLPCMTTSFTEPLQIVKGNMQYVYDEKGKEYIDAFSAVVTISVGHCHPDVTKKMKEQIDTLQHMTTMFLHENVVNFAEKLASKSPAGLQKCFFTNSGCEANELAALLAKNFTGNQEFIALRHSFHGRTLMAMSMTGQGIWRHSLPYVFGVMHAPSAYCYRCPYGMTYPDCGIKCAYEVEEMIKYGSSQHLAAFIAEPIQGFGGCITPPKEYFKIVYDIVRKYGGICISDEVQTGFGRTGTKFFGIEQWGVTPDIITMAKGIGNGSPLGGIIARPDVADSMAGKTHFNTYGGNPVSCMAGYEVLNAIEKYGYDKNAATIGKFLLGKFNELKDKHPMVGDVRGMGLMLGLELIKDSKTKEPAGNELYKVMDLCKERGVLVGRGAMAGNVIRIKPPLCIAMADAEKIVKTLDEAFTLVEKQSNIR